MYEASFGLICRPFPSVPQPTFYYPASAIEYARQTLARCIQRGEGVGVVVGPAGCGKSLLAEMLAEQFASQMRVVQLPSGRLESRRSLLQAILHGLRRPFRGMDEGELRLVLLDCLSRDEEKRSPMLLLVDEAHSLPLRLLDELRMTTNLSVDGQPCARLVLLGGPALDEKLTSPKLESFSQRIVARCYLDALSRTETGECIRAQITAASTTPRDLFSQDACDAVHKATDGVPRLINQLCDHALLRAYAAGNDSVRRETVEEAWAELQQLPATCHAEPQEDSETIIEFGKLDDGQALSEPCAMSEPGGVEVPRPDGNPPALRVAPDAGDAITRSGQRLDALSDTLDGLHDDPGDQFEPAGRIIPEVNLVYHDPVDLLNEDFQEEEVIVDRYVGRPEPAVKEQASNSAGGGAQVKRASNGSGTCEAIAIDAGSPELEMHVGRVLPRVGSKDFARLFSNLRRTAN
ncbi:MAG: ExeA family protein [Thermoguttaceae bacterium]|jgi:general secretion pathway protein A